VEEHVVAKPESHVPAAPAPGNADGQDDAELRAAIQFIDAGFFDFVQEASQGRIGMAEETTLVTGVPVSAAAIVLLARLSTKPMRLTELAAYIGIKPSSLTRQVQELEEKGLIERAADQTDGRAATVRLSERGHLVLAAAAETRHSHMYEILKSWGPEEVKRLVDVVPVLSHLSEGLSSWKATVKRSGRSAVREVRSGGQVRPPSG
jgi:DNA-binding MarR family transcriptional regulator